MSQLHLSADQLLRTTRTVRKRLDFARAVAPEVIRECLELAVQAPTGGNRQGWHFVVVTDAAKRQALADIYRRGWERYKALPINQRGPIGISTERAAALTRVLDSADYLAAHMQDAPVLLIPCQAHRVDGQPSAEQAGYWGSILPAAWSFMLAARERGLGVAWTTVHLYFEREAAAVLSIPYEKITQAALMPVAYTLGTDFAPAKREPLERVVHWDTW